MSERELVPDHNLEKCTTCGWEMGVGDTVGAVVATEEEVAAGANPATVVTNWECMNPDCPTKQG